MSDVLDDLFAGSGDPVAPAQPKNKPKADKVKPPKAEKPVAPPVIESDDDEDDEQDEAPVAAAPAPAVKKRQMAMIWIDDEEGGGNYATASRNGKTWQIKRGEEVAVPVIVIDIFNNARADRIVYSGGVRKFLPYHTVPFRVLRYFEE